MLKHLQGPRPALLLALSLFPIMAHACDDGGPLFAPMAIALLILEFILIAAAGIGWWVKHKFWPVRSAAKPGPWFFLFSFAAGVTSLFIALIGVLVVPGFMDYYIGFGSDIPGATRLLVKGCYVLGITPFATAAVWWGFRKSSRRSLYAAILWIIELGLLAGVLWAAAGQSFD